MDSGTHEQVQAILFTSTHLTHSVSSTFVSVWIILRFLSEIRNPQIVPQLIQGQKIVTNWIQISSRGVSLSCILLSLSFEIIADWSTVIYESTLATDENNTFASTLWTLSLAFKSSAIFTTLSWYYTLTTSLSKEPIISRREYQFYGYFNGFSFFVAYPIIEILCVLRAESIGDAMIAPQLFYVSQMVIATLVFCKLNRRMKVVLTEGLLVGRKSIREIRRFRMRNWYLISFLSLEIIGLMISNIDQILGKPISANSVALSTIIHSVINLSSNLAYAAATLILYPPHDYPPLLALPTPTNVSLHEKRDSQTSANARQGYFSSNPITTSTRHNWYFNRLNNINNHNLNSNSNSNNSSHISMFSMNPKQIRPVVVVQEEYDGDDVLSDEEFCVGNEGSEHMLYGNNNGGGLKQPEAAFMTLNREKSEFSSSGIAL
ncbi:7180_t:CDS:1 [Ambispora gerdemannii]|uniref:7180_t:CDS:1 n=1 Tax=Ambispora gerdemannii TaxID=144530 RepID=A0A9N9FY05_9GLOM|nr:7180_t:CDS:1 [Ambispora gerdemannii]